MEYNVDAENAKLFEAGMVPAWFRPCARELLALAAPAAGERILDLARGTGVAARAAAAVLNGHAAITGCDINGTMLDVAREVAAGEGHEIEFHQGDAGALPFENEAFDLVLCQHGMQFFPDLPAALREIQRVLTPAGRFAAATWVSEEACPGQQAVIQALEKHGFDTAAARRPFNFGNESHIRRVLGGESFPSLQISTARLIGRFDSPEQCMEVLASGAPSIRMAIEQAPTELRDAIKDDAIDRMASFKTENGLEMPMDTYLFLTGG